ncbi:MAG: alpha/beta hydrolase [Marinilabiliales bacterium]|nr:MAG: alpha/beta hydrolase [Marinilabiliales bacterium]
MDFDSIHNFSLTKLNSPDDYEGRVEATLVSRKAEGSSTKALLYVHGFIDYFFHDKFADWANSMGFNFYAIDLRKYGRSILPHQKPNNFRDYKEYFEDFDLAFKEILEIENNTEIVLYGHSTGGLLTSLYAHHQRDNSKIRSLILNSPFFEFNNPPALMAMIPLISALGKLFPNIKSPEGLKKGYAESLHLDYNGEWDFNLEYKPIEGFELNLGWISAIHRAQKEVQNGLDIKCPVLVMYSDKSVKPGNYIESMHTADAVLDVKHIAKYAKVLGDDVVEKEIIDGIHDLVLSQKTIRNRVYDTMSEFISEKLQ